MSTSYVRKWHQWGIGHSKREHALGTRLMSVQSEAAALPTRQIFSAPKLFTMMLMVRRAILRISRSVGGLCGMWSRYMEEMGSHWPFLTRLSSSKNARLFVVSSRVVTYSTLHCSV